MVISALPATAGCQSGGNGAAGAPHPAPRWSLSDADARDLLLDSWVTDGHRGFFVDGARSAARPAFSLYQTRWQLQLAATHAGHDGQGAARVSATSVQTWIGGALDGRMDASGLPPIAQVSYAAATLALVSGPLDRERVGSALEGLRDGGRYRASRSAGLPDWGATALAVRTQSQVGLPTPPQVVAAAAQALNDAAEAAGRGQLAEAPAGTLAQIVSLLEIAGDLGPPLRSAVPRAALVTTVRAVDEELSELPADPVWATKKGALARAAGQLGTTVTPVPPSSCAALVSGGGVRLPGQPAPDPQATFHARQVGCREVRAGRPETASPHSRAGWPGTEAASGDPGASASGLRVARALGLGHLFAQPLARQTREVWLPALRDRTRSPAWDPARGDGTGAQVQQVNVKLLAALIGDPLAAETSQALPTPTLDERRPGHGLGHLLAMVDVASSAQSPQQRAAARASALQAADAPDTASMAHAARLELAAQALSASDLHRRALALANDLRIAPGLYAMSNSMSGSGDTSSPSLTASTIGLWIERPAIDAIGRWTAAGLCAEDRCGETAEDVKALDHVPLRALAAAIIAESRAYGELFPLAF